MAAVTLAEFDTRNFHFQAVGTDRESAGVALLEGWAAHCAVYTAADPDLLRSLLDEVRFTEVRVGGCVRDGEVIA